MLSEELMELTNKICKQKAEMQTVEAKSAFVDCPKRLYDTLSSFSNQDTGGTILFGIDEEKGFSPVGVYDLQDLQKKVTEQCNQMEPPVRAVFTFAEIDGKRICSAEIPALDISERPCFYKGAGRIKGSYIRVGDADIPMSDQELYAFEAFRKHLHDDERPVSRAALRMLDSDSLHQYLVRCQADRPGFAKLTEEQAYEMLNVTRDGIPTVAAVLNFGIYPQGYFPQWGITAVVVPGKEIGDIAADHARFIDNKRIEGTIATMVQDAIAFCRRNMKTRTRIDPDTGNRQDQTEYPVNAIREAVLNALVHRDYSIYSEGIPVQLNFFSDRLEIHSPGGLYGRMTVEQLGYTKMDLRNPALAVMTETLTEAENRNSGIPTMRREMALYGLPEPVFENRRSEFVVTLYHAPEDTEQREPEYPQSKETNALLAFCKEPRSRQEIADYVGVKTIFYVMKRYIQPLVDAGQLFLTLPEKPQSRNQKYYAR